MDETPQGPRGQYAYEALRAAIAERRLRPGDRLREIELADRLGVSRTPVREALKRLQAEGMIVAAPSRGLTVAAPTEQQVIEIYAMREVLEGAAARFAAQHASPLEMERLRQIHETGRAVPTPELAEAQNRRFHEAISAAAHNTYLLQAMTVLRDALALLGTTTYSTPGRIVSGWDEHEAIVDAIAAHDADAAEAAARAHIRHAGRLRMGMMFGV